MIRFALPVHPDKGYGISLICPVIACDTCGEVISKARPGILLYDPYDDRVQFHVHKGQCDLDRGHVPGERLSWRDLDNWIEQLATNYAEEIAGSEVTLPFPDDDGSAIRMRIGAIRYLSVDWARSGGPLEDTSPVVSRMTEARQAAHGVWGQAS